MIVLEPVKKLVTDKFELRNYFLSVPCEGIWGSIISVTSNITFFTFIKQTIRSVLKSKGPKIEPCGAPCFFLDLSPNHSLILVRCVRLLK